MLTTEVPNFGLSVAPVLLMAGVDEFVIVGPATNVQLAGIGDGLADRRRAAIDTAR
jgi:hypothetical protein